MTMLVYQSVYVHKSKSFWQGLTFMPSGSDSRQGAIFGSGTTVDCGNGTFSRDGKRRLGKSCEIRMNFDIHEGHRNCYTSTQNLERVVFFVGNCEISTPVFVCFFSWCLRFHSHVVWVFLSLAICYHFSVTRCQVWIYGVKMIPI